MPLLHIFTSAPLPEPGARTEMLAELSSAVAKSFAKPEAYVMVGLHPWPDLLFGGTAEPACYAELKNVGHLNPKQVETLSETLCSLLSRLLGVRKDRIYIEFTSADGAMWGWNGETFG